jgi:copper(I)-binding protein
MRMRPMTGGAPIGASATLKFSPSGDHLMLIGLKSPLKAGTHVRITLQFQRAGAVVGDFVVRDAAPGGGMAGMHM